MNEPAADLPPLVDRLSHLEDAGAQHPGVARDLEVIKLQLARAEGKLLRGQRDVRREMRIVEQRVIRAERRLLRLEANHSEGSAMRESPSFRRGEEVDALIPVT